VTSASCDKGRNVPSFKRLMVDEELMKPVVGISTFCFSSVAHTGSGAVIMHPYLFVDSGTI